MKAIRSRSITYLMLITALSVTASACGGESDTRGSDSETAADSSAADTPAGTGQADDQAATESSLAPPENLTIPVAMGGTVVGSTTDTGFANAGIEYPLNRYDEISAFYDKWVRSASTDWSRQDVSNGVIWRRTTGGQTEIWVTECTSVNGGDATCVRLNETTE